MIVGGGHNGLVAGFYLARAGLKPLILERREFVGGACVTEEFAPGFRASTGAYVISMLREPVWRDMRLAERGIVIDTAGPTLYGFPDGERLLIGDDIPAAQAEFGRYSAADARPARLRGRPRPARRGRQTADRHDAPNPGTSRRRAPSLLKLAGTARKHRAAINDALFLFGTSCTQYLGEFFESDVVKAALGWHAINDSIAGPSTPGTAYVLLHDHAAEQAGGGLRTWGFVRGGIGRVTEAMADAAREAGAEIRTCGRGRADRGRRRPGHRRRARRRDGDRGGPRALQRRPEAHLPRPRRRGPAARRLQRRAPRLPLRGTSMKINLAVDRLPAVPDALGGAQPYHRGIMEVGGFLAEMDRAAGRGAAGQPGRDPHIELCFPTVHDPSLAPDGKHVATIDINSQPYTLRRRDLGRDP